MIVWINLFLTTIIIATIAGAVTGDITKPMIIEKLEKQFFPEMYKQRCSCKKRKEKLKKNGIIYRQSIKTKFIRKPSKVFEESAELGKSEENYQIHQFKINDSHKSTSKEEISAVKAEMAEVAKSQESLSANLKEVEAQEQEEDSQDIWSGETLHEITSVRDSESSSSSDIGSDSKSNSTEQSRESSSTYKTEPLIYKTEDTTTDTIKYNEEMHKETKKHDCESNNTTAPKRPEATSSLWRPQPLATAEKMFQNGHDEDQRNLDRYLLEQFENKRKMRWNNTMKGKRPDNNIVTLLLDELCKDWFTEYKTKDKTKPLQEEMHSDTFFNRGKQKQKQESGVKPISMKYITETQSQDVSKKKGKYVNNGEIKSKPQEESKDTYSTSIPQPSMIHSVEENNARPIQIDIDKEKIFTLPNITETHQLRGKEITPVTESGSSSRSHAESDSTPSYIEQSRERSDNSSPYKTLPSLNITSQKRPTATSRLRRPQRLPTIPEETFQNGQDEGQKNLRINLSELSINKIETRWNNIMKGKKPDHNNVTLFLDDLCKDWFTEYRTKYSTEALQEEMRSETFFNRGKHKQKQESGVKPISKKYITETQQSQNVSKQKRKSVNNVNIKNKPQEDSDDTHSTSKPHKQTISGTVVSEDSNTIKQNNLTCLQDGTNSSVEVIYSVEENNAKQFQVDIVKENICRPQNVTETQQHTGKEIFPVTDSRSSSSSDIGSDSMSRSTKQSRESSKNSSTYKTEPLISKTEVSNNVMRVATEKNVTHLDKSKISHPIPKFPYVNNMEDTTTDTINYGKEMRKEIKKHDGISNYTTAPKRPAVTSATIPEEMFQNGHDEDDKLLGRNLSQISTNIRKMRWNNKIKGKWPDNNNVTLLLDKLCKDWFTEYRTKDSTEALQEEMHSQTFFNWVKQKQKQESGVKPISKKYITETQSQNVSKQKGKSVNKVEMKNKPQEESGDTYYTSIPQQQTISGTVLSEDKNIIKQNNVICTKDGSNTSIEVIHHMEESNAKPQEESGGTYYTSIPQQQTISGTVLSADTNIIKQNSVICTQDGTNTSVEVIHSTEESNAKPQEESGDTYYTSIPQQQTISGTVLSADTDKIKQNNVICTQDGTNTNVEVIHSVEENNAKLFQVGIVKENICRPQNITETQQHTGKVLGILEHSANISKITANTESVISNNLEVFDINNKSIALAQDSGKMVMSKNLMQQRRQKKGNLKNHNSDANRNVFLSKDRGDLIHEALLPIIKDKRQRVSKDRIFIQSIFKRPDLIKQKCGADVDSILIDCKVGPDNKIEGKDTNREEKDTSPDVIKNKRKRVSKGHIFIQPIFKRPHLIEQKSGPDVDSRLVDCKVGPDDKIDGRDENLVR